MNYNKVILMGRVTKDVELSYTNSGLAVTRFTLAINHSFKKLDGAKNEEVCFVEIDAYGKRAEVLAEWVKKGTALLVEGRLKLDTWQDKDGNNRSKLKVLMNFFTFLSSAKKQNEETNYDTDMPDAENDDIPF